MNSFLSKLGGVLGFAVGAAVFILIYGTSVLIGIAGLIWLCTHIF